ncbi:MAG: 4a-hydroxytetrahydrobiopterin dehydratase [Sedimentisphaerales bacterium]|nr:4a-hydroxytetrahydrobiopterin dehydratase [Sedimentisphaerales bacterium]
MSPVAERHCVPCQSGARPLSGDELEQQIDQLGEGWTVIEGKRLQKEFKFDDFRQALDFVNRVGELAEEENHHPNIEFTWGKATITLWTHKIKGLHENDFILAAKIDEL